MSVTNEEQVLPATINFHEFIEEHRQLVKDTRFLHYVIADVYEEIDKRIAPMNRNKTKASVALEDLMRMFVSHGAEIPCNEATQRILKELQEAQDRYQEHRQIVGNQIRKLLELV